jgi:hypothetical protein
MEIQDIGVPGWTITLPNGMIIKMASQQGILIIPDPDPEPEDPEVVRLQGLLDFANATIEDMKEEIYGVMVADDDLAVRAITSNGSDEDMQAALDELRENIPTGVIDADDLPPGHYDR